jgi:hypothetical protein
MPGGATDMESLESPIVLARSRTKSWSSGYSSCSTLVDTSVNSLEELLVMSILDGDLARVRSLIDAGTWVSEGYTWVLYYACLNGLDMLQALLASPYIDFNFAMPELDGDAVLHLVLRTPPHRFRDRKRDIVRFLVQNGINPLQCDRLGDTALHILAGIPPYGPSGSIELLRYLLGDPNETSTDMALQNLQTTCRAHINLQNEYKNTPLVVATLYGYVDCVGLLLQYGADPGVRGEDGCSALDLAMRRQQIVAVELLKSYQSYRSSGDIPLFSPPAVPVSRLEESSM